MTASQSTYQPDTAQAPSETQPEPSPSATPPKPEGRKAMPAFVMGMLGGFCVAAVLALIALILNPLADVTERLSSVESTLAGAATRRSVETNDKRLVALEGRLDALRAEFDTINRAPSGTPVDVSTFKAQLAQIEQALNLLQQDTAKSAKPLLALSLAQDAARLTVALIITDKIEQGQSIAAELNVLATLQDDAALLADLKPWADAPPAQSALVQEFARAYPALVKAMPAPAHESLSQMMLRQLKSLVHWRRLDQQDSADPESLLHVINLHLQKGQNEEAMRLIRSLPAPMQAPITPLNRMLSQRIEALNAADHLLQTAMAQLSRTAQNKGGAQ